MQDEIQEKKDPIKWVKKLGVVGFLFFFLKGVAWLIVIFMAGKCAVG